MNFIDKKQKLDYLLKLISDERTGNAKELSERIFVSQRTLIRYLDYLRDMGFQVSYCLRRKTYYLINEKKENNAYN